MKRRYYKIHAVDHARPMKRVKHHHIVWSHVVLGALALVLVVIAVLAIIKWVGMGVSKKKKDTPSHSAVISVVTPGPEASSEPTGGNSPTVTPEPGATRAPAQTPAPGQTAAPTAAPTPAAPPVTVMSPVQSVLPQGSGFNYKIMYNSEEQTSHPTVMRFGAPEAYSGVSGITTFAGDNWRTGFSYGSPKVSQKSFETLWNIPTGSLTAEGVSYSGTGWTGQPIIVKWSDEVRAVIGVYDKFKADPNFTEVIYPALDGYIYFADLYTGELTRQPLHIGVVCGGTAALDPRGYPLLYTGQSTLSLVDNKSGAWVRVIDLIENKVVYQFGGRDPFSPRMYQAFDSSPLVSAEADTLIIPGENGVIYFSRLNARFDPASGKVSVSPEPLLKYKYSVDEGYSSKDEEGMRVYGFGSSCACWQNYLFITDNGGHLQCVDLHSLQLVYVLDVYAEADSTVVIEKDAFDGNTYLYTASRAASGVTCHCKFNALTGELIWKKELAVSQEGGTLATPHVGRGEIDGLVIYSVSLAKAEYTDPSGQRIQGYCGLMIAYDKRTGSEVWRHTQQFGYVSSPAVVYASDGAAYIVQADISGVVTLHSAKDGRPVTAVDIGSRVESTPAIFNGYLVLGTRGTGGRGLPAAIYCIKLG